MTKKKALHIRDFTATLLTTFVVEWLGPSTTNAEVASSNHFLNLFNCVVFRIKLLLKSILFTARPRVKNTFSFALDNYPNVA